MPVEFTEYEIQELKQRGMGTPEQLDTVRREIEEGVSVFQSCVYIPETRGQSLMGEPPSVGELIKENLLQARYGVKSRAALQLEGLFRWAERSRRDADTES